jgi:hypothetical protein
MLLENKKSPAQGDFLHIGWEKFGPASAVSQWIARFNSSRKFLMYLS